MTAIEKKKNKNEERLKVSERGRGKEGRKERRKKKEEGRRKKMKQIAKRTRGGLIE